jgi:hypothetical protein
MVKGVYIVSVEAPPVPGEPNTADNTYVDGKITETILGDIDGNFEVNIMDISMIARGWLCKPGDHACMLHTLKSRTIHKHATRALIGSTSFPFLFLLGCSKIKKIFM